jgi:hypothetical protein
LDAAYQTAEQTWTATEATAWATYSAAEQAALQAWSVAESSAWATYEAAAQAADQAWTVAEAAASAAFEAAVATAGQAWNAAEAAAWAQYQADSAAAASAWATAADAAMAEYYADEAAAETTWSTDEATYRAMLAGDVDDAADAWTTDEAAAFALFEAAVGSEAGDYRQSLDEPWTVSEVTQTLMAADAPDAAQPPADQSNGGNMRSLLPEIGGTYWYWSWEDHSDDPWWNGPNYVLVPHLVLVPSPPSSSPPPRAGGGVGAAPALPGQPRAPSLHEPHPLVEWGETIIDILTGNHAGVGRAAVGVGNIGVERAAYMRYQDAYIRSGLNEKDPEVIRLYNEWQTELQRVGPQH